MKWQRCESQGLNTNSFICWHPLPPDTAVNCTYYHIFCRHTGLSPHYTHIRYTKPKTDYLPTDTYEALKERKRRGCAGWRSVRLSCTRACPRVALAASTGQVGSFGRTPGHLHTAPVKWERSLAKRLISARVGLLYYDSASACWHGSPGTSEVHHMHVCISEWVCLKFVTSHSGACKLVEMLLVSSFLINHLLSLPIQKQAWS